MHLAKLTINFYEKRCHFIIYLSIIDFIMCAYDDFYLSITSKSFITNQIKVDRGYVSIL